MSQLTHIDLHHIANLANTGVGADPTKCNAQHALAPGSFECNTDKQLSSALAYWTAIQTNHPEVQAGLVADAISYLTARLAYHRDPAHHIQPDR